MGHGGAWWGTVGHGGARWGTVGQDGARWGTVGQDGARWVQMGQDGSRWVQMGQDGSKWVKMGQDGSRWVKMEQYGMVMWGDQVGEGHYGILPQSCGICWRWYVDRLGQVCGDMLEKVMPPKECGVCCEAEGAFRNVQRSTSLPSRRRDTACQALQGTPFPQSLGALQSSLSPLLRGFFVAWGLKSR